MSTPAVSSVVRSSAFWSTLPVLLTGIVVLALLGAAVSPALAQGDVTVAILEPGPFTPVFGPVEVVVEVRSDEPVERVEVNVDGGEPIVLTDGPPWSVTVDVGQSNRNHVFRAVAVTASDARGEMSLETPAIRVDDAMDVELRQLYVTVLRRGDAVRALERADFEVIDDGRRQEIVTFEGGDAPITAVLLADSSESMRGGRMDSVLDGVQSFVSGMKDLDEAKVVLFSDRLLRATPFTGDPVALEASLGGVRARGGTALTDHLFAGLKLLDGRQGRRVVVVLSDGSDVYSVLDMADVLWKVQRSQAVVYWIELRDPDASPYASFGSAWRNADANAREVELLRESVEASGGRVVSITSVDEIQGAFGQILQELRDQYVIGYYPSDRTRDGRFREVEVRLTGSSRGQIRTRGGWVDQ